MYIVICALMVYPLFLIALGARKGINAEKIADFIACCILAFFMAFRAQSVGVDTKYYCIAFQQFKDIPWSEVLSATIYGNPGKSRTFTFDFEPGYRIVNKLLTYISDTPQLITIVISLTIMVLVFCLVTTQSQMPLLSIWLYITLGIYQSEMNVSRNAIAILICYLAFTYIRKKDAFHYVICVLAGALIHETVLVFLPLYWIIRNVRFTLKRMYLMMFLFAGGGFLLRIAGFLFKSYLPKRYAGYLSSGDFSLSSILVGVFELFLFLLLWVQMNRKEKEGLIINRQIGGWMLMLNMCAFGLNFGIEAGSRIAALFGPYLICYVPQMIFCMEDKKKRKRATVLVAVICFAQYVVRLRINNIGGTMPYLFFWNAV